MRTTENACLGAVLPRWSAVVHCAADRGSIGSEGIGRATVPEFARSGYDTMIRVRGSKGQALRVDGEELEGKALTIPTCVSGGMAVERSADPIEKQRGPIEFWANHAFAGAGFMLAGRNRQPSSRRAARS